ncbi:transglycosylase domain-containing protein [Demequina globuliformis]|uniref:transglycosylase domain-containing protein n=1 Tax=Demequina globuliformis TaxID=676202 RepID=UPI000786784A|nr:transglycosylase domain-containing protein [Demequina globuliformis]
MGFFTSDDARRDGRVTVVQLASALVAFVAFSVIGGFLIAGIALPAATVASSAASGTSELFEELPAELQDVQLPQQSNIYASDGTTLLATFYDQNRVVVPLEEISPWMQQAIVAVEDKRFWEHNGVDGEGVMSAAYTNLTSDSNPGASTLTQQLVKNKLRTAAENAEDDEAADAATEVSLARKIREWRLALGLEENLTESLGNECSGDNPGVDCAKEEILQQYLNIAQFGPNIYGVEAAAQYYFSKPAKELNAVEAATIAGVTQNPSRWDPTRTFDGEDNYEDAEKRRDTVLGTMLEQDMLTQAEFDEYEAVPVQDTLDVSRPLSSCAASQDAPFFCDYVTKVIAKDEVFNTDDQNGRDLLLRGGLDIVTTLDIGKQRIANEELYDSLPADDPNGFAMAMVALEPSTGEILSMAQNRIFDPSAEAENSTSINYAVDREWGGSKGFSPGSTFKTVILANWLETGHSLNQYVSGRQQEWTSENWTETCEGPVLVGQKPWKPGNVDADNRGQMTVMKATADSINTAYAAMASQLDLCDVRDTAEAMGFERADGADFELVPSSVLGPQNSSPLTMAGIYQTFANDGIHCEPLAIKSITDAEGNELDVPQPDCRQAISKEVADGVTYAMQGVMTEGSGRFFPLEDSRPAAGKTGTANNNKHTWFAGFTPDLVSVFWLGNPDEDVEQQFVTINDRWYNYVYGSTIAGPTWSDFMSRALDGTEISDFDEPTDEILNGVPVRVPYVTDSTEWWARKVANESGFQISVSDSRVYAPNVEEGTVMTQSPGSGAMMTPGTTITIQLSTQSRPSWWTKWPEGWDKSEAPSDYWGSSWPPAEFSSNPPEGWVEEEEDKGKQCADDSDWWNEDTNEACPLPGGNGNGNGNGNGRGNDDD